MGVSDGMGVAVISTDCNTHPSIPSGLFTCTQIFPSAWVASGSNSNGLPFNRLLIRLPSYPGVLRIKAPPPVSADIHARTGVDVGVYV